LIVFVRLAGPVSILAQEADPTPTPTPAETQEQTVEPTPTPTEAQEQTSTQSEGPTPTPQDTDIEATNSAELNDNINSDSNTGDNTATQSGELDSTSTDSEPDPEASSSGDSGGLGDSGSAEIDTGDAVSVTEGENVVNTNSINSNIIHHTINLFANENGDIDLSDPSVIEVIAENIVNDNKESDETVNILATDTENYAYLSNDVVSISNTGENSINGAATAQIKTGNAISIVSLLNQVNFTIEGSIIHVVTINIFGNFNGNIILPEFTEQESCSTCELSAQLENKAVVNNNVDSEANSGENTIEYTESAEIETGDAASVVNTTNWINTNIIGLLLFSLVINVFGEWNGDFLGWGDVLTAQNGGNLILNFISSGAGEGEGCCINNLNIYSSAYVENNITSSANTGRNSINGAKGKINTGKAISVVTLSNFVNANFINSIGFFGFINIFGNFTGNIGGASKFQEEPAEAGPEQFIPLTQDIREDGGLLQVTNANNVGEYVNPGDTVTFFVDVKNPGTGKIYETKLFLYLVSDGQNVGGTFFDLGVINPGKTMKVTTGFVLADDTPPGEYIAVALAKGLAGEARDEIIDNAQSTFSVAGVLGSIVQGEEEDEPSVLGSTNAPYGTQGTNAQNMILLVLFSTFVSIYVVIRIIKKREYLAELFARGMTFKERVYSFRLFLL